MPKKKEKKNGDRQDEDKKKTKKKQSQSLPVEENDKEKDLYLVQIRFLSEQLERYQLKCKEVTNEKKALTSQCSFLEKEKEDIVDFLKHSLLEKEDELDDTSERLRALRREADQDMDALRLQLARERQEVVERSDELAEQNAKLVARLTAVEEFERQKEQMMSKMAALEKQLTNQEEAHAAALHAVEMKALLEKSRLASQMEVQAADLERVAESKLPETTRRTLQENQEVKVRYGVLSERAHDLAQENAALRDQKTKMAADVDVLEETIREMSRQSCVRKKVAEQLTSKCQQLQTQLKESSHDLEKLGSKHEKVRGQLEEVRDSHTIAIKQSSKNRALAARLEAELQQERERRSKMQEAVAAVRHVVMEAHQNPEAVRWNQLMQKLLVILEGSAPSMSDASKLTFDRRTESSSSHFQLSRATLKAKHAPSRGQKQ
ncbi:cilia- and flagella-associated protein 157-like [Entelurus aequoreus]|uniref:cilia- and flagella-associated protein 157-like n=1 Tax=Entelurus aequoreus TaxID=161455 RepID=UPI002B1E8A51|nr:cilia- and flagella-associated protein 157-like [Entelurus aequoreus]XP_061880410.1 cilia- and flagella-associated protein 157-like [Entelurus aequoreus]